MATPILLYSTNTFLAYNINQKYYDQSHYVWCTPFFNGTAEPSISYTNPPASCPLTIYRNFLEAARTDDFNDANIQRNRLGLRNGAVAKHKEGLITLQNKKIVLSTIETASNLLFRPLVYVIPFSLVKKMVKLVPIRDRANPLSEEYLIENLPRTFFDVFMLEMG